MALTAYNFSPTIISRNEYIPASVEALAAILDHYGFEYFFKRTLSMIDLDNDDYADAVGAALEQHFDEDPGTFSLHRTFKVILCDLYDEEGFEYEEALEFLAEEDYVVPVTTAMAYSADAGETDIEHLSRLIRSQAKRALRHLEDSRG